MNTREKPYLILASQSPRRRMLLEQEGYQFQILPSRAEEIEADFHNVEQIVCQNARLKGEEVVKRLMQEPQVFPVPTVLLASDTLVAMNQRVFPKPKDLDQAHEFIQVLGGNTHQVHTGVYLHHMQQNKSHTFLETTHVKLFELDEPSRTAMFERVNPLDKAGAYGAQDAPEIIKELNGYSSTVIGLPVETLAKELAIFLKNT